MRRWVGLLIVVLAVPLLMGAAKNYDMRALGGLMAYFDPATIVDGQILAYDSAVGDKFRTYAVVDHPASVINFSLNDGDAIYASGPGGPTAITVGTTDMTVSAYDFDKSTVESLAYQFKLPNKARLTAGTDMTFTIRWRESAAHAAQACNWGIAATALGAEDALAGATVTTTTSSASANSATKVHTATVAIGIDDLGAAAGDTVFFKLYREADVATDTFDDDANMLGVSVDIPMNPL